MNRECRALSWVVRLLFAMAVTGLAVLLGGPALAPAVGVGIFFLAVLLADVGWEAGVAWQERRARRAPPRAGR